jgi:hypothetical protein
VYASAVARHELIGEFLHYSYANLAMAHAAVSAGRKSYGRVHFMIRGRLYKGLRAGTMKLGPLADDERLKLVLPQACAYCGSGEHLSVDHLVPRDRGGADVGDNLVWSCRSCNSAKGARDLLAWYERKATFLPLLLLRRYLKLAIGLASERGLMDRPLTDAADLPVEIARAPQQFPPPSELKLWVGW